MTAAIPVQDGRQTKRAEPLLPTSFLPTLPKSKTTLSPLTPADLSRHIFVLKELYLPPIHGGISGGSISRYDRSIETEEYSAGSADIRGLGLDIPKSQTEVDGYGREFNGHSYDDDNGDEHEESDEDDDDDIPKPHLDPFERDWSEKWLNGIVRRAQGWIEENPDAEDEGYREGSWGHREVEGVLRDSTAVLAIMAGTSAAGSLTRHLGFPIDPSLGPALRNLRKSIPTNPNHSPETDKFLSSLSISPTSPTTSFLSHSPTSSHHIPTSSKPPSSSRTTRRSRKSPILPILLHDAPMSNHLNVGVQTWGSAILLGRELALHPHRFGIFRTERSVRILELGAGTGLLSILCQKLLDLNVASGGLGGEVVATDFLDDVLDNLRVCVDLNQGDGVKVRKLDWSTFPRAIEMGDISSEEIGGLVGEGFDLVLASDCVYDETHAEMIRDVASWVVRLPDDNINGDTGGTLHILSPLRPTFGPELQSIDTNFPTLSSYPALSERNAATAEDVQGHGLGKVSGLRLGVRGEGKKSVKGRKGEGRVDEGDGYWWWEVGWG